MSRISDFLSDAEARLDQWGKGAWIGTMILGFVVFWPIGLIVLGYMLWSGRMGCKETRKSLWRKAERPTGNTVFDTYREETLRRLAAEQASFEEFLGRLRVAKDQAEFDQFMSERRAGSGSAEPAL